MRNLFKLTYDVKVGRNWLGGGNANGYTSDHVLASGDAIDAAERLRRHVYKQDFAGQSAVSVRVLRAELVAKDVI